MQSFGIAKRVVYGVVCVFSLSEKLEALKQASCNSLVERPKISRAMAKGIEQRVLPEVVVHELEVEPIVVRNEHRLRKRFYPGTARKHYFLVCVYYLNFLLSYFRRARSYVIAVVELHLLFRDSSVQ